MKPNKNEIITCPNCGREYLPSEIFVPQALTGRVQTVDRDYSGRVLEYMGMVPDMTENYICDNCNKPFKIIAKISYRTEDNPKYDFTQDYKTSLKEDKITLFEDI